MKQKKEKGRQVFMHSSLTSDSGPRPVVKVKKHFEAVLGGNCKRSQNDAFKQPNLVNTLPSFVANDLEAQEEYQHQLLSYRPQDTKRKWKSTVVLNSRLDFMNKTKTKSGSVNTKTPPTTSKSKQNVRKEGCKRQMESHIVSTNATSSVIGSSSAVQENLNFFVVQPSGAHLQFGATEDKRSCLSDTYGNKVSFPVTMNCVTSERKSDITPTWTSTTMCSLLQKPYEYSLYTDNASVANKGVNLRSSVNENSDISGHKYLSIISKSELFPDMNKIKSYEVSKYRETYVKKPNDKTTENAGMMQHISKADVLESGSSLNAEERTKMVREIQLELVKWRQKQSNAQTFQYGGKIHVPVLREGEVDSEQLHQNIAASDNLTATTSKHDLHWKQQPITNTNDGNSLGSLYHQFPSVTEDPDSTMDISPPQQQIEGDN